MSRQQRLVIIISVLASFVAFLDSSVVNVALPSISNSLGGGLVSAIGIRNNKRIETKL